MRRVSRAIESARTQSTPKRRNWRRSERILVAVNLTEDGGELVTWALTHGSRSGDTVTVIHVVEPCPASSPRGQVTKWERQKKDMINLLSEVVTYCRTHHYVPHLEVIVQVVENKSVGEAIVEEARSLEATRVILGKHKSRRLDISPKRITYLGSLCVQNLEPHCEIIIVRQGRILIRKPGTAKFRRSLETLLLSNKVQESSVYEKADSERQLVVKGFHSKRDKSHLGPKESPDQKWQLSSSSSSPGKPSSRSNSSGALSDYLSLKSMEHSSLDYSFSSGASSGGSESSPKSVLRISYHGKSSLGGGDKIKGSGLLFRSSSLSSTQSSQAGSLKAVAPARRSRSRSASNSLESVPELPELVAKEMKVEEEGALAVFNPPQLENRKEHPEEQRANVCVSQPELEGDRKDGEQLSALVSFIPPSKSENVTDPEKQALVVFAQPQLQDRKEDDHGEEEENAIVLSGFSPLDLEKRKEDDGREELVSLGDCSPPKFAKTCSAVRYSLSEDGLQSLSKDVKQELPEVRRFSYEELQVATQDFALKNVVGTGGASSVYKGQLSDGRWVALKRLVDDTVGEKEFMMEMMMLICTLNHPNVVTMLGFCAEGTHRLIAYKLLTRGSLERNLHNSMTSRKLNWEQRQKVAFGASRGLAYLHNFTPKQIVHRDIKTSNILLADDFEAQISDFGLARWISEADTAVFDEQVSCAGTFGYLAPECLMYGGFNDRTDIFAFGVVLLELISGRRPMDESLPDTQQSLVLWARTLQQNGRTHFLVDRSLKDINPQQFKRMMYTAFLCVQVAPEDRPTMDRVVKLLDPACNYSPAILQPNISAPPFMSMPEFDASHQQSPLRPNRSSYPLQ